jgi:serine/threonine protein kinase
MLIASDTELVAALAETRLLEGWQLDELTPSFRERFPDSEEFLRQLTLNGWLTAYQAGQLLQGNGHQLRLGPYVLLERLGAGGMGEVFKARHDRLNRTVALKLIAKQHVARERMLERFRREAEAAARLTHPNIVTLYDAGESGDTHYLVMEFIDGVDLARLLETTGPLPLAQACDYARQAALGLQHAHERGLVHRDIKPANLLVKPPDGQARSMSLPPNLLAGPGTAFLYQDGTVKLLDLGTARLHCAFLTGKQGPITGEGVLVGTLDYVAPEQARDSHAVDGRADLYGLGCTLYHLLAGSAPYAQSGGIDKLIQHVSAPVPPLRAARADAPAALAALVARLMAKRPEDRHQTAAEVADALAPFTRPEFAGEIGKAHPSPTCVATPIPPTVDMPGGLNWTPVTAPAQPPRRAVPPSKPWRWAVGAGLAVLAAAVVALLFRSGLPGTSEATTAPGSYLPADTAALVSVNVRELWSAPIVRQLKTTGTADHLARGRLGGRLQYQLRYDPEQDVDQVRVLYGADTLDRPLYQALGRFDRAQFRLAPPALERLDTERHPPFTVYRSSNTAGNQTTFATDGRTLLCCQDRQRVADALAGRQAELRDGRFKALFHAVNQQQTVWFAADLAPYRGYRPSTGDAEEDEILAAFFAHAESVYGGIRFKKDAEAVVYVETRDQLHADRFEQAFNDLQSFGRKCAGETTTQPWLQPLARCLARADLVRHDTHFVLHFRLTPDLVQ